jgi:hypothetical protein
VGQSLLKVCDTPALHGDTHERGCEMQTVGVQLLVYVHQALKHVDTREVLTSA